MYVGFLGILSGEKLPTVIISHDLDQTRAW